MSRITGDVWWIWYELQHQGKNLTLCASVWYVGTRAQQSLESGRQLLGAILLQELLGFIP